jgi:hypothetical protein
MLNLVMYFVPKNQDIFITKGDVDFFFSFLICEYIYLKIQQQDRIFEIETVQKFWDK